MENAPDGGELEENTHQLWGLFNFGVWFQHNTEKWFGLKCSDS